MVGQQRITRFIIRFFLSINLFLLSLSAFADNTVATITPPITIYVAKKIITMDPIQPEATAVAVKDGRIYAVGSVNDMVSWMKPNTYTINKTFANAIMTPGMIEAHAHWTMLVLFMSHPYVGYWDFPGVNGMVLPASKSKAAVLERLKAADKSMTDPNAVLFAWGYDPIYFNNNNLTVDDLNSVSTTRPIFVLNASEHIGYVNQVLLNKIGFNAQTNIPGVEKYQNGQPNGVLQEAAAMAPALFAIYEQLFTADAYKKSLYGTADTAHRLGLTTVSDLLFGGPGEKEMMPLLTQAANDNQFPLRTVIIYNGLLLGSLEEKQAGEGVAYLKHLRQQDSNKLRFNGIKFISDGSIQGFTSRLFWPGYFNGMPNGLFNMTTDQINHAALPFWKAGVPIHVHVNGDQAIHSALDVLEMLQTQAPSRSNVFVLEHDQMSSPEQFVRAKRLGAYANIFANHIYYWGDQHYAITLGPDRAARLDDAKLAKQHNIIFSLHSDSPVTPLGPLHSMWAATNRVTASGRVLGANARITAEDALRAVTLNAAYLLSLQDEVGSIAIGKRADFTVLQRNPLTEPIKTIKDIPVVATIQDGHVFLVNKLH